MHSSSTTDLLCHIHSLLSQASVFARKNVQWLSAKVLIGHGITSHKFYMNCLDGGGGYDTKV